MLTFKRNKGQSTVEYILLVTAVVAVMILFTTNKDQGFQAKLNATLDTTMTQAETLGQRLANSQQASPVGTHSGNTTLVTNALTDAL